MIRCIICIAAQQSVATAVRDATTPRLTKLTHINRPHYSFGPLKKLHLGFKTDCADARQPFLRTYGGQEYAAVCCRTAESTLP